MILLLVAAACLCTTLAHFSLDFPASRGFEIAKEVQYCGGFPDVGNRQAFPLRQAPVWITNVHESATFLDAVISLSQSPVTASDFNTTSNTTALVVTKPFQVGGGSSCWNINMSALDTRLLDGTFVTLQIHYNDGTGDLYQCADLVLQASYTVPASRTCLGNSAVNASISTPVPSASQASPSRSASGASDRCLQRSGFLVIVLGTIGMALM